MADITKAEFSDALQKIAEQFHAVDQNVAKLAVRILALKVVVAARISPGAPIDGLKLIENLEEELAKLDPHAEARQRFSDVIEMLKVIEKHGGPKQA
jgi:hypothetical protein